MVILDGRLTYQGNEFGRGSRGEDDLKPGFPGCHRAKPLA